MRKSDELYDLARDCVLLYEDVDPYGFLDGLEIDEPKEEAMNRIIGEQYQQFLDGDFDGAFDLLNWLVGDSITPTSVNIDPNEVLSRLRNASGISKSMKKSISDLENFTINVPEIYNGTIDMYKNSDGEDLPYTLSEVKEWKNGNLNKSVKKLTFELFKQTIEDYINAYNEEDRKFWEKEGMPEAYEPLEDYTFHDLGDGHYTFSYDGYIYDYINYEEDGGRFRDGLWEALEKAGFEWGDGIEQDTYSDIGFYDHNVR